MKLFKNVQVGEPFGSPVKIGLRCSLLLFKVSIKMFTALSPGIEGYKRDLYLILIYFPGFASCTNVYELIIQCMFLFKVGCVISTKYLDVPYGTVPIVDTIVLTRERLV